MSSEKRWRQVGQGEFRKWITVGQSIEGIWRGQHEGKFGPLGAVDTETEGRVTFPLHTALLSRVEDMADGQEIRIVYRGLQSTKDGTKQFKAFDVFTTDDRGVLASDLSGDDIPF